MDKHKKINKTIFTLSIIEGILIIFFLTYLLTYSIVVGGDALYISPVLFIALFFMVLIPIGLFLYYLAIKFRKRNLYKFELEDVTIAKMSKKLDKKQKRKRFSDLLELDVNEPEVVKNITFDEVNSLEAFTNAFRNFCASRKKLYYSIDDIRSFIASLLTSKTMILQGMSGTGKTSIALAFEEFIGNPTTVIAVQPVWKERSDLLGYYNEFTKKFNETPLLKELYRSNFSDQIFIIVLDEVNIARIEYYFAEFLSLLEYPNIEQRTIEITNDSWPKDPKLLIDGRMQIKRNVYFLGTANNDESTFSISDKVYDRAMIMNLNKKAKEFESIDQGPIKISNENFENLAKLTLNTFSDYDKIDEMANKLNKILIEFFQITFGNRMMNQLKNYIPIYIACGGEEMEAFDDFVYKKILRKLENKDALKVSNAISPFIEELNKIFGTNEMKKSKKYLTRFEVK